MLPDNLSSFSHRPLLPLTTVLTLPQSKVPCHQLDICPERPIIVFEESLFLKPIHRDQAVPILRIRQVLNELAEPPFSADILKEPAKLPARPPVSNSPPQPAVWRVGFSSIPSRLARCCVRYSSGETLSRTWSIGCPITLIAFRPSPGVRQALFVVFKWRPKHCSL